MSSAENEVVSANHGLVAVFWKEVAASADCKVRPKNMPANKDDALVARTDPALDEIRYGSAHHDGKSIADINGLNVHLSDKFQVQFLEYNRLRLRSPSLRKAIVR